MNWTRALLATSLVLALATFADAGVLNNTSQVHFKDFTNATPTPDVASRISLDFGTTDSSSSNFGWHSSPHTITGANPEFAGMFLGFSATVTQVRFSNHGNPFKDFTLQGSNNSTTGFDGAWTDLHSGTITTRSNLAVDSFAVSSTQAFSAYRVRIESSYEAGWAMFRMELTGEAVPEPRATLLLLALPIVVWRRRTA